MSLKAEVIYELNTEQFVPAASTAERALQTIESKSVSTAKTLEETEKRVSLSTRQLATSMLGLGTSAFSAYQGIDQLEKVQLRSEKAALAVARAQKQVNDLEREGKASTEEYVIATERLRLAQEQASIAAGDVKQQTIQLGLSLVTTGFTMATTIISLKGMTLAHGAAATAATAQAAANTGLTLSFRGLTAAMMSNPLGIALVAGSIGALAVYQTNLLGVRDKVDGLISSFTLGKQPVADLHSEFKQGIETTQSYADSVRDLGAEYDNTLSKLKKNDISTEIDRVQGQMSETMFFMGSLEQMFHNMKSAGVEGFVKEMMKDTREVKKNLSDIGFRDTISDLESSFSSMGLSTTEQHIFRTVSGRITDVFRYIRAQGISSLSRMMHGNLSQYGGLGRDYTEKILSQYQMSTRYRPTNPGGSIGTRAQSLGGISAGKGAKGKSSKHGGAKPGWGIDAVEKPFLQSIQSLQSTIDELALFGFTIQAPRFDVSIVGRYKSPSNEFLQSTIRGATANYEAGLAEYNRQVAAARAQISQDAGFIGLDSGTYMSMYTTSQGRSDIEGMKLYKQLASLG